MVHNAHIFSDKQQDLNNFIESTSLLVLSWSKFFERKNNFIDEYELKELKLPTIKQCITLKISN